MDIFKEQSTEKRYLADDIRVLGVPLPADAIDSIVDGKCSIEEVVENYPQFKDMLIELLADRAAHEKYTLKISQLVKERILEVEPTARVFLYGSQIRGDYRTDSNWNYLVLTKKEVNPDTTKIFWEAAFQVQMEFNQIISISTYSQEDWENDILDNVFVATIFYEGIEL